MSLRDGDALGWVFAGGLGWGADDTRRQEALRRLQLAGLKEVRVDRPRRIGVATQTCQIDPADVEREMAKSRQVLRQEARLAKKGRKA